MTNVHDSHSCRLKGSTRNESGLPEKWQDRLRTLWVDDKPKRGSNRGKRNSLVWFLSESHLAVKKIHEPAFAIVC